MFHLRIRLGTVRDGAQLRTMLDERCIRYMLYHESVIGNPGNDHLQGIIETRFKEVTICKAVTDLLTAKGNRAYSVSTLRKTHDELAQYCAKDGRLWASKGYAEEQLAAYQAAGAARKEALTQPDSKRTSSAVVWLYDEVLARVGPAPFQVAGATDLMQAIIDVYTAHGKLYPYGRERALLTSIKLRWLMEHDKPRYEACRNRLAAAAAADLENIFSS